DSIKLLHGSVQLALAIFDIILSLTETRFYGILSIRKGRPGGPARYPQSEAYRHVHPRLPELPLLDTT
ncbi:MAG: hypothetical protein LUE91_01640, partial [Oscillospiraceae bacterium]|nr:hypothetical protein [Oscillospiraceae bacterium]